MTDLSLIEKLKALRPYIQGLRIDASGEGRMPPQRMYALADALSALLVEAETPTQTGGTER